MPEISRSELARLFEQKGLKFLGIALPETGEEFLRFQTWLEEGRHAEMQFLEKHALIRQDPRRLLSGARTVLMFALPYDQGDVFPVAGPAIAQYARLRDYHKLLRELGTTVIATLHERFPGSRSRVFVDSAPVLERALAARTAQGFIGKNTCYIHPNAGSFLLLAGILTSIELAEDVPVAVDPTKHLPHGGCGACRECQRACPTGALDVDYRIDSRRCLAYWTIEHRGPIPEEYWPWLGTYYFGCDICQLVCPYNLKKDEGYLPPQVPVKSFPGLYETAVMDQAEYERFFGGTPLTRAKKAGLKRNALIAMTVTEHPKLEAALRICARDESFPIPQTLSQIKEWRFRHANAASGPAGS